MPTQYAERWIQRRLVEMEKPAAESEYARNPRLRMTFVLVRQRNVYWRRLAPSIYSRQTCCDSGGGSILSDAGGCGIRKLAIAQIASPPPPSPVL